MSREARGQLDSGRGYPPRTM
eukprot:gene26300-biopygen15706